MFRLTEEFKQKETYTQKVKVLKKIARKLTPYIDIVAEPIQLSKGLRFYTENGVCISARFNFDAGTKYLKDHELWLLRSGSFLIVELKEHKYSGGITWIDGEPKAGYGGWDWKAEPKETNNPPEPLPTPEELKRSIAYLALKRFDKDKRFSFETSLLSTVKEIDKTLEKIDAQKRS